MFLYVYKNYCWLIFVKLIMKKYYKVLIYLKEIIEKEME